MATEIIMPKAGMSMEEGTIVRWLKEVGDPVENGEGVMEIETDKITMENEAPADGVLLAKFYGDGAVVPVTTIIGYIGKPGEKVPDAPAAPALAAASAEAVETAPGAVLGQPVSETAAASSGRILATPLAKTLAGQNGVALDTVTGSGAGGVIKARDVVKATPLAARMAEDRGIDIAAVSGTGFGGKITSADLPAAAADGAPVPLAGMRKVIAQRMTKSHLEIPPVTQTMKAYAGELLAIREKINETRRMRITINDMVMKACAKAVAEFPQIRTEIDIQAGVLITRGEVNIGMAVSLDDGLIVPVIHGADKLSLSEVSARAKDLAARARTGGLSPNEYSGSTFTVSNVGALDIFTFTPIINQPNAAIMGVGCINEELALVDGEVAGRKYLMLSLTYDHRIIDGSQAAVFQKRVKQLIESPLEILV